MAPMVIVGMISLASTAISTSASAKATKAAGEEAARIGELTAVDIEAETAEEARRLADEQKANESMALAMAAASGVDVEESTSSLFLESLSTENKAQLDWLKSSGLSKANLARESGASAASNAASQASAIYAGGLATGIGQAAGSFNSWYTS